MTDFDPDELDIKYADEGGNVAWGVEVESSDPDQKSVFHSARRVVLDAEYAQIQHDDGTYTSYPIEQVRKILAMRADPPTVYTDEDLTDELY
jgi:hypothetical protein